MLLGIDGVEMFFVRTTVNHVINTYLIDPDTKLRIDKSDEELEKRLYDTDFVDDVRTDFYIDDIDEADEAVHGDGYNTLSEE